jgi:hypothetical protein
MSFCTDQAQSPYNSKLVMYKQDEFLSQRVDLIAEDQCGTVFIDPRCVRTSIHMATEHYCTLQLVAFCKVYCYT